MKKQERLISYILIVQAVIGLASTTLMAVSSPAAATAALMFLAVLPIAALIAGIGALRGHRWAALLGIIVFAVQVPVIQTESFSYSMWLGFHAYFGGTWNGVGFGVNVIGLILAVWAMLVYRAPDNSLKADGTDVPPP